MKSYFTAPASRYSEELAAHCPDVGMTTTVIELEPVTRKTGLLDAGGRPILVREQTDPIGFVRFPLKGQ